MGLYRLHFYTPATKWREYIGVFSYVQCCVHKSSKTIQWIYLRLGGKYNYNLKMYMWFACYTPTIIVKSYGPLNVGTV